MKEVTAIIRLSMFDKTKKDLKYQGFNALTYMKVKGRGKKEVDYEAGDKVKVEQSESVAEGHRLIAKKMLVLIVADEDLDKVVETIMKTNHTGNSGDGKIFIRTIDDAARVRTGEEGTDAI
ncbi:MAG: P-II family nitrogen regulator [Halanaerobacter sp.]